MKLGGRYAPFFVKSIEFLIKEALGISMLSWLKKYKLSLEA